jgi:hypothetical protein
MIRFCNQPVAPVEAGAFVGDWLQHRSRCYLGSGLRRGDLRLTPIKKELP